MHILIAQAVEAAEVVSDAGWDLGRPKKIRRYMTGRACTWLLDGTNDDLAKARAHAARQGEGWIAVVAPPGHPDPLAWGREQAIKADRK